MRQLLALPCFLVASLACADSGIDCSRPAAELSYSEQKICTHRELWQAREEYRKLMDCLRTLMAKRIVLEREDPASWRVGWGVSTQAALANMEKSDVLWRKLHEVDCSIEIDSPSWAGGSGAPHAANWCRLSRYKDRIEQVRGFMQAWELDRVEDAS